MRAFHHEGTLAERALRRPEAPQPLNSGVSDKRTGAGDDLFEVLARHLDQRAKGGGVADGQVGEDLAIDFDAGGVEAGDEAAVAHVVLAGSPALMRCIQRRRHVALTGPPVAERVLHRLA